MNDIMYRVTYLIQSTAVRFKKFDNLKECFEFSLKLPTNSILEIKYYEDSVDNRPAFWSEE